MNSAPRVAFIDIETAPSLGYYFDKWKEGNIIATQHEWYMLSFAYKWMGEKRVRTCALPDYPRFQTKKDDDRDLIKDLHRVFDEADILIAHNGDRFDIKKSNARFIEHGLEPPSPYKTIDTLKIAKRHFRFDSNRLDALGQSLSVGRKLAHTGTHLWLGCMHGDPKSWRIMRRYNARDVELLERVYEKLKPWAAGHPNLSIYDDTPGCPVCRSTNVQNRGFNVARTRKTQRLQCRDCAHWFSAPLNSGSSKNGDAKQHSGRRVRHKDFKKLSSGRQRRSGRVR